jgi:ABC-type nitrate/sulfonate/bicarbonate transport system substrate-binding protein
LISRHERGRARCPSFSGRFADAIHDKRPELEDFLRRLTAARAWSLTNVSAYAETWGKLMHIPPAVPLNWLSRAKIRIAPIDDDVVADEQKTIDLYFRAGLIKQKLNAADIVDRSFSNARRSLASERRNWQYFLLQWRRFSQQKMTCIEYNSI